MNVHHLELFYYVARFKGITAAVKKMPYGIQQPAVSAQVLQLEESLGLKLFNRRPFALTAAGEELYAFCEPFFSGLETLEERLREEEAQHLRLAASAATLRTHLPEVLVNLRKELGGLKLSLREVDPSDVHQLLVSQQIDVAIGVLSGKLTEGLKAEPLMKIPVTLWVPVAHPAKRWQDLVASEAGKGSRKVGVEPLIGLPKHEVLQQNFETELEKRQVSWPVSVEVNSMDIIREYALRGFGIGVGLDIPGATVPKGLRGLPMRGFPPLVVGAIYQGRPKRLVQRFLTAARERVAGLT